MVLTWCWLESVFHVVLYSIASYLLYAVVDQLPRLGKRELVFLLLSTCNCVVSVSWRFLFLLVLGMDCVFLLWHSLGLPLIILNRERLGWYFLMGPHFPKWTDVTDWQNLKRSFVNLKKARQITEIRFWPIRAQLNEPLSAEKNLWSQNDNWSFLTIGCHFGSPKKLTSIKFSLVSSCVGSLV